MFALRSALATAIWISSSAAMFGGIFTTYKPIKVVVLDAETDMPISGATVTADYYSIYLFGGRPKTEPSKTGERGIATLRVATGASPALGASADGYLSAVEGIQNSPATETHETSVVFRLYRGPAPRITIVVPNGYRGPLKIDMRRTSCRVQEEIGKRNFTFRASSSGYVRFDATPLLLGDVDLIHAAFEDGQPIEDFRVGPTGIGLRWVESGGSRASVRHLFVIGTSKDQDALQASIEKEIHPPPTRVITRDDDAFNAMFPPERDAKAPPIK